MTGKSYGPTEMIIRGLDPRGGLPGLPAGEGIRGGRIRYRPYTFPNNR